MNSTYAKLIQNLEYLKLKQMVVHLDETIDFMTNNQLSFTETLVKLTDYEIDMKEINMVKSMVQVGGFPHHKEIKDFDFDFQPSINKQQILDFTTLRFIELQENIVFLGSSGVGKTSLATSIGIAAAKKEQALILLNVMT
jgi:DNA replication protein DnaC